MGNRSCNIVFQGGGVRGIAYAGVLAAMPGNLEIMDLAGTSAGALVAALVAKGYRGEELKKVLEDPALSRLLMDADVERQKRLQAALAPAKSLIDQFIKEGVGLGTLWRIRSWKKAHPNVVADLIHIWREWGVHRTDRIREWLD